MLPTIVAIFTLALLNSIHAGPTLQRTRREIYPEIEPEKAQEVASQQPQVCVVGDLVYGADEPVPADQPCLKCKCQPPGVHCEATRCQKKPGCRAIHKPNTCCPDYQCASVSECIHEGKTYGNGERLEQKPGTECKVCYCRGGEVQCAEVSCYIRNDCEGRQVPGKCCPKYDHCPPREPLGDRTQYPMEIINATKEVTAENEINETTEVIKVDKAVQTETQKITIQEIIPEIKEIPITNSPKQEIGQLIVEEAIKTEKLKEILNTSESNELAIPDVESDSSEVAEVYQTPPPVLVRVGDQLLYFDKGELIKNKDDSSTPSTVITIIGAEGLQRGFEDSVENHEIQKFETDNTTHETTSQASSIASETIQNPENVTSVMDAVLSPNDTLELIELSDNSTDFNATEKPQKPTTEETTIHDTNPEYPPLPDVMSHMHIEDDHLFTEITQKSMIEAISQQNNSGANLTSSEILRNILVNPAAALPESVLKIVAESDLEDLETTTPVEFGEALTINEFSQNNLKLLAEERFDELVSTQKSVESLEESTNSGTENASVEEDMKDFNVSDLVEILPGVTTQTVRSLETESTTENYKKKEVEMVDVELLKRNATHEENAKITKLKRENMEDDKIFEELDREISLVAGDVKEGKSVDEEQKEAESIFKELMGESESSTTKKPLNLQGKERESAVLQKVSEAIARHPLRDNSKQSLDSRILGILKDFFNTHYRSYKN